MSDMQGVQQGAVQGGLSTEEKGVSLASVIESGWESYLLAQEKSVRPNHDYVYASAWRKCTRRMVLEMTQNSTAEPWSADMLAKFRRGKDRERDIIADLARIGRNAPIPFEIMGQQERFELRDHKGRVAIVGKKDAEIKFVSGESCPIEVKAWDTNLVKRISRFEDLFNSPWTKAGAFQILAYLYGYGRPKGFMILDRSGIPKVIEIELETNLQTMEDFLTRAEIALDHKEDGTLPPFVDDPEECQRCPFNGRSCLPSLNFGDGAAMLSDPEIEEALNRRADLEPLAKEYKELDETVKDKAKPFYESGQDQLVCGSWFITGKKQHRKGFTVKESDSWVTKIARIEK